MTLKTALFGTRKLVNSTVFYRMNILYSRIVLTKVRDHK